MKNLEKEIYNYLTERSWDDLRPSDLAKSIVIEAAELLEIFQWEDMTIAQTLEDTDRMEKIEGELADVLIYALDMAVLLGLDTETIVRKKLQKVKEKYPVELVRREKRSDEPYRTSQSYLDLKEKHRKKS